MFGRFRNVIGLSCGDVMKGKGLAIIESIIEITMHFNCFLAKQRVKVSLDGTMRM